MFYDFDALVVWGENAKRFVFQHEFTGVKLQSLPYQIFGCLQDAQISGADTTFSVDQETMSVVPTFAAAFKGVRSSTSASSTTGLGTDEILVHSDFCDGYFRLGLVLSDDKASSMILGRRLIEHAKSLGETLVLATS